jgi:hypothetical protein
VQSRIYVNGSVDLATNSTGPRRASCNAQRSGDGSNTLSFNVSPLVLADLHAVEADSTVDGSVVYVPLTVSGSLLLPPGTYNIGIVCTGSGTLLVNNATMNVLAVPASS